MSPSARGGRAVIALPAVVGTTTGALFTGAGAAGILSLSISVRGLAQPIGVLSLAVGGALLGLAILGGGRNIAGRMPHPLVAAGTALITAAVLWAGSSPLAVALAGFYVLIALESAFFFSTVGMLAHLCIAEVACAVSLSVIGPFGAGPSVVVGGTALLVAGVVAWLVRAAAGAEVDSLTGVANRRGLDRILGDAAATGRRHGTSLVVALIDLDHFKAINDRGGHLAGDRQLVRTVAAWGTLLGPGQLLARNGGDEFTLILPDLTVAGATELVDRLRAVIPGGATASAGIAAWDPDESLSLLLSSADVALFQAKRAGRNRTHAQSYAFPEVVEVRDALAGGELRVYYQPVVDMTTGVTVGTEALLRWQHPDRGLVPPAEFLPLVEGSALMIDIGRFVLAEACRQTARWRRSSWPLTLAVNATGQELLTAGYASHVEEVLRQSDLPARALTIEVTETSLDGDDASEVLDRLRGLGVQVAIDDFGTGYSSLSRLGRLPATILKIDKSFVGEIDCETTSAPIIEAIVALAAALGLEVLAEGVEHPHQASMLQSLGCVHAQGYFYSPAVPAAMLPRTRYLTTAQPAVAYVDSL